MNGVSVLLKAMVYRPYFQASKELPGIQTVSAEAGFKVSSQLGDGLLNPLVKEPSCSHGGETQTVPSSCHQCSDTEEHGKSL